MILLSKKIIVTNLEQQAARLNTEDLTEGIRNIGY